jgi:hypothetical protein
LPVVDQELDRHVVAERSFWVAAGLAAIGGIGPLIAAAGHTNRLAGIVVPFLGAAGANAALALLYRRGRSFSALVYFIGGLAIAYGLLLVLAIPLRIAVEGSCPPAPQRCAAGLELQLSGSETFGLSIAVAFGAAALLTGFFGLLALYRHKPGAHQGPSVWPSQEPTGWKQTAVEEEKPAEPKPEELKAEEPMPEEPKADEPMPEELKAEEPKPEEPKPAELKPEEPKAEEPKAGEPKLRRARVRRAKGQEPKPEEPEQKEAAEPPTSA